jgi:plastocyanin
MRFGRIHRVIRLLLAAILLAACADPLPTTSPPDQELREQIHAATGHEPPECTDFTSGVATITITAAGFEPECAMVSAGSELSVTNQTDDDHTFTVSDGSGNVVVRHIRVDESLPPGARYDLEPVDSLLGEGIYPFWSKGHQEEGFAGTLIVRP